MSTQALPRITTNRAPIDHQVTGRSDLAADGVVDRRTLGVVVASAYLMVALPVVWVALQARARWVSCSPDCSAADPMTALRLVALDLVLLMLPLVVGLGVRLRSRLFLHLAAVGAFLAVLGLLAETSLL